MDGRFQSHTGLSRLAVVPGTHGKRDGAGNGMLDLLAAPQINVGFWDFIMLAAAGAGVDFAR